MLCGVLNRLNHDELRVVWQSNRAAVTIEPFLVVMVYGSGSQRVWSLRFSSRRRRT